MVESKYDADRVSIVAACGLIDGRALTEPSNTAMPSRLPVASSENRRTTFMVDWYPLQDGELPRRHRLVLSCWHADTLDSPGADARCRCANCRCPTAATHD